jgi:hypothetical protein
MSEKGLDDHRSNGKPNSSSIENHVVSSLFLSRPRRGVNNDLGFGSMPAKLAVHHIGKQ